MKLVPSHKAPTPERRSAAALEVADRPTFTSRLVLPVAWETLGRAPAVPVLLAAESANAAVLDTLIKSFDIDGARAIDERLADAIGPLRIKVDLALAMLTRLSYRDVVLPEAREVEVGLSRIAWSAPKPVPVGGWLGIKLFFSQSFREPVLVHGRTAACAGARAPGEHRIEVALAPMAGDVSESFARLVFLEYRRRRAQRLPQPVVEVYGPGRGVADRRAV